MLFGLTARYTLDAPPFEPSPMFRHEESFGFFRSEMPELTVETARLGAPRLCRVRSTGHRIGLREPENYSVLLPRRGRIMTVAAGREHVATPGEMMVFSPNLRETTVMPDDGGIYECDCLLVPAAEVASALGVGRPAPLARVYGPQEPGRAEEALRRYARFLTAEAGYAASPLGLERARVAAGTLLGELLADLLLDGDFAGGALSGDRMQDRRLVRRAEDLMNARLDEPLAIGQIAAALGVGTRRLQYAFQRVRGFGPRERLGTMRLDRARELLTNPDDRCSVGTVALDCGFAHFGRFSIAYRQRFGERPSETLQRHRRH